MTKKKENKEIEVKDLEITSGLIKDDFCDYTYDIKIGVGAGDTVKVKGRGIVDDDMSDAFRKFNAHLAAIDDVFKHANVDVKSIDKMHNHELTALYFVNGFTIKGSGESECIILKGTKHINSTNGRIELETPKIPLDNLSSYPWAKELKRVADEARNEVEAYKNGKYTEVEIEDKPDPKQLKIDQDVDMDLESARA